jgi:hypothetical protein
MTFRVMYVVRLSDTGFTLWRSAIPVFIEVDAYSRVFQAPASSVAACWAVGRRWD